MKQKLQGINCLVFSFSLVLIISFHAISAVDVDRINSGLSHLSAQEDQAPSTNSNSPFRTLLDQIKKHVFDSDQLVGTQSEAVLPICDKKVKELGAAMSSQMKNYEETVAEINKTSGELYAANEHVNNIAVILNPKIIEFKKLMGSLNQGGDIRDQSKHYNEAKRNKTLAMLQTVTSLIHQIDSNPDFRFKSKHFDAKKEAAFRRFLQTALDLPANSSQLSPQNAHIVEEAREMLVLLAHQMNDQLHHIDEAENVSSLAWGHVLGTYQAQNKLLQQEIGAMYKQKQEAADLVQRLTDHLSELKDSIADSPSKLKDLIPQYKVWATVCGGKKDFYNKQQDSRDEQTDTLDAFAVLMNDMDGSLIQKALEKATGDITGTGTNTAAKPGVVSPAVPSSGTPNVTPIAS